MRAFKDFKEAVEEVKRDLKEMGIKVHSNSYQNKIIKDDPDFATHEIQNYTYTVLNPNGEDLEPTQPWADAEFEERVSDQLINPGEAYKLRNDVWEQFLNPMGRFDYTYNERYSDSINLVVKELKKNPDSRQCFIPLFEDLDLFFIGGDKRVPCSLGYLVQIREGKLNITYLQRSADFSTHFNNDLYLTHKLQKHIAELVGVPAGTFTHWIGSLHVYYKDIKDVF